MFETSYFVPENVRSLRSQFLSVIFASKRKPFKDIFGSKTADDWDFVAAVEHLTAFTIVSILFSCPLGSWIPLWNFETLRGGH